LTSAESVSEPITIMFVDHVKPDKLDAYEAWVTGIHRDLKDFPGFLNVDVIKPQSTADTEYIGLVKFDCREHLEDWLDSSNVADWIARLPDLLLNAPHAQEAPGLDVWFTRPMRRTVVRHPMFWKQVVLGVVTVYPMILLLDALLVYTFAALPKELSIFIVVCILSVLLTYPIMPFATWLLRRWLYPDP